MALTELEGTDLGSQTITIEQGPVRAFAEAVLDDPDTYTGNGAPTPPTWPFVMSYWGSMGTGGAAGLPMDKLRGKGRMILHGEQAFDITRPPRVGETLTGTGRISEVYEKATSSAVMEFYVRETDWRDDDGEPVVTDRFTLIVRRKPDAEGSE
ncbi:MAG: MaoC family dehydratase [Actinomycetia bacterium]|nr:MaoC family dehydratase [Actinomycetes bacterium]